MQLLQLLLLPEIWLVETGVIETETYSWSFGEQSGANVSGCLASSLRYNKFRVLMVAIIDHQKAIMPYGSRTIPSESMI